jgi:hypothetical protein
MNTMNLIIIENFFFGVLQIVMNIPLVLRQVPMNKTYRIRILSAFESEKRWYDINAYGGRQMLLWCWLPIAAGVAGIFICPAHSDYYAYASLGALLMAVLLPLVLILRWSRRR